MGLIEDAKQSISSDVAYEQNLLRDNPDVIWVNIEEVSPDATQPRKHFDEGELEALADTIRENGVLQPIMVKVNPAEWRRDIDKYIIVFGERRYRASLRAGVKKVPIIVRDVSAKMALMLQTIENVQRVNLASKEEANAYIRMQDEFGLGTREIARLVRKDHGNVGKLIRVFRDDSLGVTVDNGSLPLHVAAALLPLPAAERQRWARNLIRRRNKGEEITPASVTAEVRAFLGKPTKSKVASSGGVNYTGSAQENTSPEDTPAEPASEPPKAGQVIDLFGGQTIEPQEQSSDGDFSSRSVEINEVEDDDPEVITFADIAQSVREMRQEMVDAVPAIKRIITNKEMPDAMRQAIVSDLRTLADSLNEALAAIE